MLEVGESYLSNAPPPTAVFGSGISYKYLILRWPLSCANGEARGTMTKRDAMFDLRRFGGLPIVVENFRNRSSRYDVPE